MYTLSEHNSSSLFRILKSIWSFSFLHFSQCFLSFLYLNVQAQMCELQRQQIEKTSEKYTRYTLSRTSPMHNQTWASLVEFKLLDASWLIYVFRKTGSSGLFSGFTVLVSVQTKRLHNLAYSSFRSHSRDIKRKSSVTQCTINL